MKFLKYSIAKILFLWAILVFPKIALAELSFEVHLREKSLMLRQEPKVGSVAVTQLDNRSVGNVISASNGFLEIEFITWDQKRVRGWALPSEVRVSPKSMIVTQYSDKELQQARNLEPLVWQLIEPSRSQPSAPREPNNE